MRDTKSRFTFSCNVRDGDFSHFRRDLTPNVAQIPEEEKKRLERYTGSDISEEFFVPAESGTWYHYLVSGANSVELVGRTM